MKSLAFYILKTEDKNNANIYHNMFRNSLIKLKDGKFYFHSKYSPPVEINYIYSTVNLNVELIRTIERIYESSLIEARKISVENMGVVVKKGEIISNITSIINKFSYYNPEDEKDFFDLITEIFIRILMGHYLTNGNKRLALTMLKAILWNFGYYLKFTEGMWKEYNEHKTNENNIPSEYAKVKKWIMNNVIIGLNWREK